MLFGAAVVDAVVVAVKVVTERPSTVAGIPEWNGRLGVCKYTHRLLNVMLWAVAHTSVI